MSSDDEFRKIDELVEEFLEELKLGSEPDATRARFLSENRDIKDELDERLRFVENVFFAVRTDHDGDITGNEHTTGFHGSGKLRIDPQMVTRIECPHCGNKLNLVTAFHSEITCGVCGSAVTVKDEITKTCARIDLPRQLGKFVVQRFLGQGGFGTAYRARDTELNRTVALKIPRVDSFLTANAKERFIREARNAAKLRHSNIVQVYEIGSENGMPFIVSDYIEGVTLRDLMTGQSLTFKESVKLMIEISEAVHFAHENGIIHRDLKPSNILLDMNNKPHVTDFGLARNLDSEITMTLDGDILGTPAYMSPEQATGQQSKTTCQSDLYSLGVVLYRMICGELPFRGSQRMMLHHLMHDDPKPPRKINEKIPYDLETITLKAMAKDPTKRYVSARAFADDLRRWLSNRPIYARPVSAYEKFTRWCRRNPGIAALSAAITGLLVVITGMSIMWAIQSGNLVAIATKNKDTAIENLEESTARLTQLHVLGGLREMEEQNYASAFQWFAGAIESERENDRSHRIRAGMLVNQHPKLCVLKAAESAIRVVDVSGDGRHGLLATRSGQVIVFDFESGETTSPVLEHGGLILAATFDSTGNRIAVATADNRGFLWETTSGRKIAEFQHDSQVRHVLFSPDGRHVVSASDDGVAKIWNPENGQFVGQLEHPEQEFEWLRFVEDPNYLLTSLPAAIDGSSEIRTWDIETQTQKLPLMKADGKVTSVDFDPKNNRIYTASRNGVVEIWNVDDGKRLGDPLQHNDRLSSVYVSSNSASLVTIQYNGEITVWDLEQRQKQLFRRTKAIIDTEVDSNKRFLAISHNDGTASLYWLNNLEMVGPGLAYGGTEASIRFHPDGRRFLIGGNGGVARIWDLAGLAPDFPLITHDAALNVARFSPDGTKVVSCSKDGVAKISSATLGQMFGQELKHEATITDCSFNKTGNLVATSSGDSTAQFWDAATGTPVGKPLPHNASVVKIRFSPKQGEEDFLITASHNGELAGWKAGQNTPVYRRKIHSATIGHLAISDDGNLAAATSLDKSASIWMAMNGASIVDSLSHEQTTSKCDFSLDGTLLATCGSDGRVKIWQTSAPNELVRQLKFTDHAWAVKWGSDNQTLLTANYSGQLDLWVNEQSVWEFENAKYGLMHCQFDPSWKLVAACGLLKQTNISQLYGSGAAFLIDAESGTLLSPPLYHFGPVIRTYFDPQGTRVLTSSEDGSARIWKIEIDERPTETILAHANVLSGFEIDERTGLKTVAPAILEQRFNQTQVVSPESFRCTQQEINSWADYIKWVESK